MFSASLVVVVGLLLDMNAMCALGATPGDAALIPFDEETSSYSKAKDTSPIARLQERSFGTTTNTATCFPCWTR